MRDPCPVREAPRMLQAGHQQILAVVDQLAGGQRKPEKLHACLIDLVGFVKHHDPHRRQELGHTRFAHGQIGKKEMVVDDHDVCSQGLPPGQMHVAFPKPGALRTKAVLPCGRDQRHHRRPFVQARQFGKISGPGCLRPAFDLGEDAGHARLAARHAVPSLLHPVQAQIARTTFQERHAQRQPKRLRHLRQITRKQLVLQRLGGSRQQHPLTAQKGWHEIGKGLAHPGARLHDQCPALLNGFGHRQRHLRLAVPRLKVHIGARQDAIRCKHLPNRCAQIHHVCPASQERHCTGHCGRFGFGEREFKAGTAGWQKCHSRADNTRLTSIPRSSLAPAPPQSPA